MLLIIKSLNIVCVAHQNEVRRDSVKETDAVVVLE